MPILKTRPILFSAPMVRAVLDGSKTQTRRIVTPASSFGGSYPVKWCDLEAAWPDGIGSLKYLHAPITHAPEGYDRSCVNRIFPRIAPATDWDQEPDADYEPPASRLWVREAWAVWKNVDSRAPRDLLEDHYHVWYKADGDGGGVSGELRGRWRSSLHMPRWASRITLEVTEVRVERLQEISEDDAQAEGITRRGVWWDAGPNWEGDGVGQTAKEAFIHLWDSLNAKRAPWDSNPWVWVVSFKRIAQ